LGDDVPLAGDDHQGTNSVGGMTGRINARIEPSDISHLGMVVPFEVFQPNDPLMTNVGRVVERTAKRWRLLPTTSPSMAAMLMVYCDATITRFGGEGDLYWNGGPWFLASSWYGEYFARWQDYVGGKSLVDTNKVILDSLIAKLGPMGFAFRADRPRYQRAAVSRLLASDRVAKCLGITFYAVGPDHDVPRLQTVTNNTCAFARSCRMVGRS